MGDNVGFNVRINVCVTKGGIVGIVISVDVGMAVYVTACVNLGVNVHVGGGLMWVWLCVG